MHVSLLLPQAGTAASEGEITYSQWEENWWWFRLRSCRHLLLEQRLSHQTWLQSGRWSQTGKQQKRTYAQRTNAVSCLKIPLCSRIWSATKLKMLVNVHLDCSNKINLVSDLWRSSFADDGIYVDFSTPPQGVTKEVNWNLCCSRS